MLDALKTLIDGYSVVAFVCVAMFAALSLSSLVIWICRRLWGSL